MKKFFISSSVLLLPALTFAQQEAGHILVKIMDLLQMVIPILVIIAVIYFIVGLLQYLMAKDDEKKAKGRIVIINGIIALFVMLSIWGIIGMIQNTTGIGGGGDVNSQSGLIPTVSF